MPVPIVAQAGSLVPLSSIFEQSFGTATPAFYGMTLLPTMAPSGATDYWGQPSNGTAVAPEWYVNGRAIGAPTVVQPGDDVALLAGNNIHDPAEIQMQVTSASTGTKAEYVDYDVWTTDPAVEHGVLNAGAVLGAPTPADVVAAAAGVPLPQPNAQLDPSLNGWLLGSGLPEEVSPPSGPGLPT